MPEPMSEPPPVPDISPLASPPATPSSTTRVRPPRPPTTTVVDAPSSRGDVTYQGPVETTTLISYTVHPSPEEEEAALPRRDRIVQICQSDHMLDWIHALATITIMKEPAITGGNTATEQILMWKHRVNSLRKVPWIFAPSNTYYSMITLLLLLPMKMMRSRLAVVIKPVLRRVLMIMMIMMMMMVMVVAVK